MAVASVCHFSQQKGIFWFRGEKREKNIVGDSPSREVKKKRQKKGIFLKFKQVDT